MSRRKWKIPRTLDGDVFARMVRIAKSHGVQIQAFNVDLLGNRFKPSLEGHPAIESMKEAKTSAATWHLDFHESYFVHLNRLDDQATDIVDVNVPDAGPPETVAKFLGSVEAEFPPFMRAETFREVIGDEAAEFYRARELALARLEAVNQKLIEETAEYRRKVEEQADALQRQRIAALEAEREELRQAVASEREALDRRASEIEEEKKRIDDSTAKYARRGLRENLQKALREYSEKFSLTEGTSSQRSIVHRLFQTLIALAVVVVVITVAE